MTKKNNTQVFLGYLISISIIMGASIYNYLDHAVVSRTAWKALQIICFLLSVIAYRTIDKKTIRSAIHLLLFFIGYAIISFLFSDPSIDNLIAYIACFVTAYLYVSQLLKHDDYNLLIDAYTNLLFVITVISLFFWLFGSVLHVIPYTIIRYHYGYGTIAHNFFGVYFDEPYQNTVFFGIRTVRNCGICMEAPGFANLLMYGLGIELIKKNSNNKKKVAFILGLITNFSSKSYLILAVSIAFMIYKAIKTDKNKKIRKLIVIVAPLLLFTIGITVYMVVMDKAANSTRAYNGRINSLQNALIAWRSNPIVGVGINNYEAIDAGSMGVTLYLAQCGLYGMALYVYAMFAALRSELVKHNKWCFYLLSCLFWMNFIISNVGTSTLTIITVSTAITLRKKNRSIFGNYHRLRNESVLHPDKGLGFYNVS